MNHHQIIIDDYVVDRQKIIGKGSNGMVYECRQSSSNNNELCCKLINLEKIKQQSFIDYEKAQRELEILQHLKVNMSQNKNVVQLLHACKQIIDQQEFLILVMEKCDSDLKQYLQSNKTDQKMAIKIIRQIINGYMICYENQIMHRDIKPANILVKNDVFKLSDFGEGKITESLNEQLEQTNTGTYAYASLQINMGHKYSAKSDIYSLGLVFYEILYGQLPFEGRKSHILKFHETLKNKSFIPPEKGIKGEIIAQAIRDLLEMMITYEESDRISWKDLFSHELIKLKLPQQTNLMFNQIPRQQIGQSINQQTLQHPQFQQDKKIAPFKKREHSESLHEINSGQKTIQPTYQQKLQQSSQIPIVGNNQIPEVSRSVTINDIQNQKELQLQPNRLIQQQLTPKTDFQKKNEQTIQFFPKQLQIPTQIKIGPNQTLNNQQRYHTQPNDTDNSATNPKTQQEKELQIITPQAKHIQRGLLFIKKFKKEYQKIANQNNKLEASVDNITDICQKLLDAICYQIYQKSLNKPVIDTQFKISDIGALCEDKIYQKYMQSKSKVQSKTINQLNNSLIEQLKILQQEFPYNQEKTYSKKYVWLVQRIKDIVNQEIDFDNMSKYFSCDRCL